jgi:hypothetical protein
MAWEVCRGFVAFFFLFIFLDKKISKILLDIFKISNILKILYYILYFLSHDLSAVRSAPANHQDDLIVSAEAARRVIVRRVFKSEPLEPQENFLSIFTPGIGPTVFRGYV